MSSGNDLGMVGAGLSAYGAYEQAEVESGIADYNAKIADQNAAILRAQGAESARRSLVNSSKMIGTETAGYASSGVSGVSSQAVLRDSAAKGQLNALTIQNNAEIKAISYENEANLDRYRSRNDLSAGYIGVASQLLKGLSQYGSSSSGFFGSAAGAGAGAEAGAAEGATTWAGADSAVEVAALA